MAKLSAHGNYTVVKGTLAHWAYCGDQHILRNQGFGWKLWRKLKPHVNYKQKAQQHKDKIKQAYSDHPAKARFNTLLKQLSPSLHKRQFVMTGIELLTDDPDGLWSELDSHYDTQNYLSFDDCNKLCESYRAAIA